MPLAPSGCLSLTRSGSITTRAPFSSIEVAPATTARAEGDQPAATSSSSSTVRFSSSTSQPSRSEFVKTSAIERGRASSRRNRPRRGRLIRVVEKQRELLDGRDASPLSIRERSMDFEILGGIEDVRVIAKGRSVRERARLKVRFGPGRWRKLKGIAIVRLRGGDVRLAELHWYKAHGIGRRELKIKRLLD